MSAGGDEVAASVLASLPDPVAAIGPATELLWMNPAAEARSGWTVDDLAGRTLAELVHPDDLETAMFSMASVVTKEVGSLVELRLQDRTGSYSWYEIRGRRWEGGPEGSIIMVLRESTDRRRWEVGAGDPEVLGAVLDAAPTITILLEPDGTIRGANRALTRWLHRPLEGTLGVPLVEIVAAQDQAAVAAELAEVAGCGTTRRLEARFLTTDGEQVPMSLTLVDLTADEAVRGLVATATDITSLVSVRSELHHLASHDGLTGLPNRSYLREHLAAVMHQRPRVEHTVLFGDVDGLKPVNDRHGHRAGDAVLVEVARRLRQVMRDGDFVARVSGDEFVVVLPTRVLSVVDEVRERITAALVEPIALPDGTKVRLSMSIGAATTETSLEPEDLLAAADAAMYVAKRERNGTT
jgi:diguanylate cyclase (GGDEF)-like protein/PAS domain S-box-containing protein